MHSRPRRWLKRSGPACLRRDSWRTAGMMWGSAPAGCADDVPRRKDRAASGGLFELAGRARRSMRAAIHRHTAEFLPWAFFRSWGEQGSSDPALVERRTRCLAVLLIDVWLAGAPGDSPRSSSTARPPPHQRPVAGRHQRRRQRRRHQVAPLDGTCAVGPRVLTSAQLPDQPGPDVRPGMADRFLDAYLTAAEGFVYDPYWDIDSLLDMSYPEPTFYEPLASISGSEIHCAGGDYAPDRCISRTCDGGGYKPNLCTANFVNYRRNHSKTHWNSVE